MTFVMVIFVFMLLITFSSWALNVLPLACLWLQGLYWDSGNYWNGQEIMSYSTGCKPIFAIFILWDVVPWCWIISAWHFETNYPVMWHHIPEKMERQTGRSTAMITKSLHWFLIYHIIFYVWIYVLKMNVFYSNNFYSVKYIMNMCVIL